jgi:hypothetical protein
MESDESLTIYRVGQEEPLQFASNELKRYLIRLTGKTVRIRAASMYRADAKGVWVGTAATLGAVAVAGMGAPQHPFDDSIFVSARARHVVIAGVNPRSVVFAAYRYLEELGCRWLRPGRQGERLPRRPKAVARRVYLRESPSNRHRCICIEGSCSAQHVRDMIDWAAKRGFNSYFLQFRNSYEFFKRWYCDEEGKGKEKVAFSQRDAFDLCESIILQLRKRGMIVHRVGHGWTCDPFGVAGNEWTRFEGRPPNSIKRFLALRDGTRVFFNGVPIDSQLCFSNPAVRTTMARAVVNYAASHPDEEVIHVWLGDGKNNHCECSSCAKARPSDFYVQILNEIDEQLSRQDLDTRIVFLAYVDLLWAPIKARLRNPPRFILMFAPITRSYATPILDDPEPAKTPRFVRNRLPFPESPKASLKLLDGWRKSFSGDCVDFDYHLYRAHCFDPGQMALARVLFNDIVGLGKLGMSGFISCQLMRVCFPTGLWMHSMGKALWDEHIEFDSMVDDYFADVFGRSGPAVRKHLTRLSELFDSPVLPGGQVDPSGRKAQRGLAKVSTLVEKFSPKIEIGVRSTDPTTAAAWRIMREHAWYVCALAELCINAGTITPEESMDVLATHTKQLQQRHRRLHHVLDVPAAREAAASILAG